MVRLAVRSLSGHSANLSRKFWDQAVEPHLPEITASRSCSFREPFIEAYLVSAQDRESPDPSRLDTNPTCLPRTSHVHSSLW